RLYRGRGLCGWCDRCHSGWYDGDRVRRREPFGLPARRGAQIRGSADDCRRPATFKERRRCAPWVVASTTALLLLPCYGLFRRLRRLLLVLVTDFVKADINDISVEFRPRWQRKCKALLDIDELNVCLGRRNDDRNPFELGDDGLRLRSLTHDCIAQGNFDLP